MLYILIPELERRTARFIGVLRTALLGVIAIRATAAAVALHQEVQTMHFMQQWQKDSEHLWLTWWQVDFQLHTGV